MQILSCITKLNHVIEYIQICIHAMMHRTAEEQQIILMKNKSNYLKRYILMVIYIVLKHIYGYKYVLKII